MKQKALLIISLFFCIQVLGKVQDKGHSILRGSKSGSVSLFKDHRGFYVGGDFDYDYLNTTDDRFGPNTYPLMLGLYTSKSLLSSDCLAFSNYDCEAYHCQPHIEEKDTVSYPYFTASGNYASSQIYFEYNKWNLKADSLLASSCESEVPLLGNGTYGIIGLGAEGTSKTNFLQSVLFSIYLEKDEKAGSVIFGLDLRYADSPFSIGEIKTDLNWQASFNGYLSFGRHSHGLNSKLIFDLNTDVIGLPSKFYYSIISYLSSYGVNCSSDTSQPNCSYSGFINDLPSIVIVNGTNGTASKITISPQIYIQYGAYLDYFDDMVLNIRALGSNYTQKSYVTPDYENVIILGSNFMSNYFTVFDGTGSEPKIVLYKASKNPKAPTWIFIVAGVVVVLVLGCICKCCYSRKRGNRSHFHSHPPLIINAQKVDYVQPVAYVHNPNYVQQKRS